jgi:uncharacterized membrane protein YdjX (TVP38/TMEM64 family)
MWKWVIFGCLIALLFAAYKFLPIQSALQQLVAWIDGLGPWGPLLYIMIYGLLTVILFPGWVMTVSAGMLFGLAFGTVYALLGATLGATAAFLVGRYVGRSWLVRKFRGSPRFLLIDKAVADEGWKIVGLTRLSPVFPFTLLNYAFSLTAVSLREYVLASCVAMIPGTVMYVYIGWMAEAGTDDEARTVIQWALYGIGFVATVAATLLVTRIARKALSDRLDLAAQSNGKGPGKELT